MAPVYRASGWNTDCPKYGDVRDKLRETGPDNRLVWGVKLYISAVLEIADDFTSSLRGVRAHGCARY